VGIERLARGGERRLLFFLLLLAITILFIVGSQQPKAKLAPLLEVMMVGECESSAGGVVILVPGAEFSGQQILGANRLPLTSFVCWLHILFELL
jgi:hypothetical protein